MLFWTLLAAASAARPATIVPGIPDAVLVALIAAFSALLGAAASQLGAFGILYFTLRSQANRAREERTFRERQERDADRRALRDQKRERLRGAYAAVIAASLAMGQVVREGGRLLVNESRESQEARFNAMLLEALVDINKARVVLMMETTGREVLDTFDNTVFDAFISFRQGLDENAVSPGSVTHAELKVHRDDLQLGLDALIKAARTRLELLEQVLPG